MRGTSAGSTGLESEWEILIMPMIDVYAPEGLFPPNSERDLGEKITRAVLHAEGVVAPTAFHLGNTAAFIHLMPAVSVQTAASANARAVRVQVLTPPNALTRDGQKLLVKKITDIIAGAGSDSSVAISTWVLLTEAAEGGWGIAGTAFGQEEFIALARRAQAT